MIFTLLTDDKLKAVLSCEDMDAYDLSYQVLDYEDINTKEFISDILFLAKIKTGFTPNKSKLLIEVYPYEKTGCVLYFTSTSEFSDDKNNKNISIPVIFMFSDIDVLIDAGCRLFKLYCHRIYKSSLYLMDNSYRLIIYPLERCDSVTTHFLSQYGERIGDGIILASYIEEHGKPILEQNAIDKLAYYLG